MKKFLAFLLIAIIACTTVEDIDLESLWKKIKNAFKKGVKWLKDKGIFDTVKNTLIKLGKQAAIALCAKYIGQSTCETVVNQL